MAIWQDLSIEKEHIGQKPGNLTNTNAEGNSRHAQEGGALKLQCKTTRITGSEEGKGERERYGEYTGEREQAELLFKPLMTSPNPEISVKTFVITKYKYK